MCGNCFRESHFVSTAPLRDVAVIQFANIKKKKKRGVEGGSAWVEITGNQQGFDRLGRHVISSSEANDYFD